MEYKFTESNFQSEVLESDIPVLMDLYADWCGPCKMMAPLVHQLADDFEGKVKIGKMNVDENIELAQKYRVMSIPTFVFFKQGEAVETIVGGMSKKDLEDKIEKILL